MTPKQKAAQIYDQYWSDVSRRPASNKDPLPDIRPLIEQAIIAAVEEGRAKGCNEERAAIGYQLGLLRAKASPQEALVYDQIVMLLSNRASS
jgi:hypothetical protein